MKVKIKLSVIQLCTFACMSSLLISSCAIEKRRYASGYNFEWTNSHVSAEKYNSRMRSQSLTVQEKNDNETLTASVENVIKANNFPPEKASELSSFLSQECDTIILKNGNEIRARVSEITADEIKFKECDHTDDPLYSISKSEVSIIKYWNGTKDIISEKFPATSQPGHPINPDVQKEKKQSGVYGILSIAFALSQWLVVPSFILFLFFGLIAIILGLIGQGPQRALRGLALVGLALGSIGIVILILIALGGGIAD